MKKTEWRYGVATIGVYWLIAAGFIGCGSVPGSAKKDPCRDEFDACVRKVSFEKQKCLADGDSEENCEQTLQEGRSACDTLHEDCLAQAARLGTQYF